MIQDLDLLKKKAIDAKSLAYAPYSKFSVGAAILSINRQITIGCNIENLSFTPTVCAERVAIFTAIANGIKEFKAIAIATDDDNFTPPCGVCRQVLSEFVSDNFRVILMNIKGEIRIIEFSELFPFRFNPKSDIGAKKVL